ncbi:MAG: hypothetical protein OHK0026_09470 [Rhodocyclaceae bacterium]
METPAAGRCYSNAAFGRAWSVRRVLHIEPASDPARDRITYKVLVGPGRRRTDTTTRADFERWLRYEVVQKENEWLRVAAAGAPRDP